MPKSIELVEDSDKSVMDQETFHHRPVWRNSLPVPSRNESWKAFWHGGPLSTPHRSTCVRGCGGCDGVDGRNVIATNGVLYRHLVKEGGKVSGM